MGEQSRVIGMAIVGAAAGYLFFTERGRMLRDRMEPAIDELQREFGRFQGTIQKLGDMANDGLRVVNEFQAARAQATYPQNRTSH